MRKQIVTEDRKFTFLKQTKYIPVDDSDYPVKNKKYIAFEKKAVSFFPGFIEPNYLTWLRIFLSILLFILAARLSYKAILIMTSIGGLTDFFDGALARSNPTRPQGKKTRFGVIMDPFADKLLIFSILYILLVRGDLNYIFLVLMAIGEIHIFLIPIFSYSYQVLRLLKNRKIGTTKGFKKRIEPVHFGRIKLHFYIYAIIIMLFGKIFSSMLLVQLSNILLIMGISAAILALCQYLARYWANPY